jgi:hypothetical protein
VYVTPVDWPPPQLPPLGFVTVTDTAPAEPDGAVTVSWVVEKLATVASFEPKATVGSVDPAWQNPWPLTVTELPPVVGPLLGEREMFVGAAAAASCESKMRNGATLAPAITVTVTNERSSELRVARCSRRHVFSPRGASTGLAVEASRTARRTANQALIMRWPGDGSCRRRGAMARSPMC